MQRVNGRESGQGLVEYALILVLVGAVVVGTLMVLGPTIGNVFSNVVANLQGSAPGSASGVPTPTAQNCDPCYPTLCIPPPPPMPAPELDCADIPYRNFVVVCNPDPYRFDGGHDGVGCEQ
jgi:Flp pilus assembly pilin Flp